MDLPTIQNLQREVVAWADETFPNRTPPSAFMKLFEELGEVVRKPADGSEWADVLILVLDLMRMHGHSDPHALVVQKLAMNRNRRWSMNGLGVFQHLPENGSKGFLCGGPKNGQTIRFDTVEPPVLYVPADTETKQWAYVRQTPTSDREAVYAWMLHGVPF